MKPTPHKQLQMNPQDNARYDRDNDAMDTDVAALAETLVEATAPAEDLDPLRERLLASTARPGRLARFAPGVARLADLSEETAAKWLERLDDGDLWERGLIPGVEALWVEGGPAARNAIRGFVRVAEGHAFPEHEHLGPETVLVIQGIIEDSDGNVFRPGDIATAKPTESHSFRPRPGGVDALIFSVVFQGIRVGDQVIPHRD